MDGRTSYLIGNMWPILSFVLPERADWPVVAGVLFISALWLVMGAIMQARQQ